MRSDDRFRRLDIPGLRPQESYQAAFWDADQPSSRSMWRCRVAGNRSKVVVDRPPPASLLGTPGLGDSGEYDQREGRDSRAGPISEFSNRAAVKATAPWTIIRVKAV